MPTYDGSGYWPAKDSLSPEIAGFLSPREMPPMRDSVVAGARAGIAGSLVASAFLIFSYVHIGGSALLPARILALQLTGDAGIAASAWGIVAAALTSLLGGAAFGALFGVVMARIVGRMGLLAVVGVGAVYGMLVWIVTQFVLIAYIAPQALLLYDQQCLAMASVAYGGCLGLLGRAYRCVSWLA